MYLFFDKQGKLKEVINDQPLRQASSGDKMYIYFDGYVDENCWLKIEKSDGTFTNEYAVTQREVRQIPYDANRDLKFFKDYTPYGFFVYTLTSGDLDTDGLTKATVRLVGDDINALGLVTFHIESSVVAADKGVSVSQYDYLIELFTQFEDNVITEKIEITGVETFNDLRVFLNNNSHYLQVGKLYMFVDIQSQRSKLPMLILPRTQFKAAIISSQGFMGVLEYISNKFTIYDRVTLVDDYNTLLEFAQNTYQYNISKSSIGVMGDNYVRIGNYIFGGRNNGVYKYTGTEIVDVFDGVKVRIDNIVDGTTVVKKAEQDSGGRTIEETYVKTMEVVYSSNNNRLAFSLKNALGEVSATALVTLLKATTSHDGLLSAADKIKLDDLITTILGYINSHDTDTMAHVALRQAIGALQAEIDRLDGKGKSYGMIDKTQSELLGMSTGDRNAYILGYLQNKYVGYTAENGHLIYTLTVVGENEHEWEFNGTNWVDNGAWTIEKASNTEYGLVKGDGDYINIVNGIIEILKANVADKVGTVLDFWDKQMLDDAFAARYTKDETDNLIDQLKAIYGWEQDYIDTFNQNNDVILYDVIEEYDFLIFNVIDGATGILRCGALANNEYVEIGDIKVTFNGVDLVITNLNGEQIKVYGIKLNGLDAYQIDYDTITVGEALDLKADKIEVRQVGEEVITYTNGKITGVDSDTVTTTISYDIDGNVDEIIEFYKLDSKTYKTTLTKDVDGKITKVTKELI